MNNKKLQDMKSELNLLKEKLTTHPLFEKLETLNDLAIFMEWHVFPVWDFMSLNKRLQRDLTCVTLPWLPPKNRKAARLINEIICGEETDINPKGGNMSHYELYSEAMKEVGANTSQIEKFVELLYDGEDYVKALNDVKAPEPVKKFVKNTLDVAINGSTENVIGSFFFGRENVIPPMFQRILDKWKIGRKNAPLFSFYLDRHIQLDAEEHGPAALAMINDLFPDAESQLAVYETAIEAVKERIELWDELQKFLNK